KKYKKADDRKIIGFFHICPESNVPVHIAWGLERHRLQAMPGSRNVTESSRRRGRRTGISGTTDPQPYRRF
ncbi:hypothetical protein, partial [Pandoraea capi]|uniref:hypothetical protein n=1 Tax=Pandoraea capi TaxID=2508286 RepID=UPI001C2DB9A6